jgi:hypothetical protein
VLRIAGKSLDVDALLATVPKARIDQVWHRGQPNRLGRVSPASGISVTIWEGPTTAKWKGLLAAMKRHQRLVARAQKSGASAELDIGIDHDVNSPTLGVRFPPPLLELLSVSSVDLVVSTYLSK